MKLSVLLMLCFLATAVYSSPTSRKKRSAMAMAGGWPYGFGAYADAGFPWSFGPSPWNYPRSYMPPFPFFPMPVFPTPWYEGENVCKTNKTFETPKEIEDWMAEASTPGFDYSHESEQCRGSGATYVCVKKVTVNGVSKIVATKYECCHGFVRDYRGAGCVESKAEAASSSGAQGRRTQDEYKIVPQESRSASSSTFAVGKIPAE